MSGLETRSIGETATSDTKPRVEKQPCDEDSQTNSSYTTKSDADVIVIDESDDNEAAIAVYALKNSVGMDDGARGDILPKFYGH